MFKDGEFDYAEKTLIQAV